MGKDPELKSPKKGIICMTSCHPSHKFYEPIWGWSHHIEKINIPNDQRFPGPFHRQIPYDQYIEIIEVPKTLFFQESIDFILFTLFQTFQYVFGKPLFPNFVCCFDISNCFSAIILIALALYPTKHAALNLTRLKPRLNHRSHGWTNY